MSLLPLGSVAIGRDLAGLGDPLAKDATVSKTRLVLADDQTTEPPTTGLADHRVGRHAHSQRRQFRPTARRPRSPARR